MLSNLKKKKLIDYILINTFKTYVFIKIFLNLERKGKGCMMHELALIKAE